jgi:hypothetical protein
MLPSSHLMLFESPQKGGFKIIDAALPTDKIIKIIIDPASHS